MKNKLSQQQLINNVSYIYKYIYSLLNILQL